MTMGNVVLFTAPRQVGFDTYEERPLREGEVRLRTLYSGISAGTELTAYRGSNPYLQKRWDGQSRLFVEAEQTSQQYPLSGWGYEEVGEVVEVAAGVEGVREGDRIFGTWGHRTTHIAAATDVQQRIMPADLDPILGIFSQIGAIALNGVHDARIRIGETVAVFGLGVPGQIVAQLARRSGARVIGVDFIASRLTLARELGALDMAINAEQGSVAEQIKQATDGRGADVTIEVSGAVGALHEAIRATAYSSVVVAMGFFQGGAGALMLGEEFHHNRINIVASQISGVAPDLSYRWNRLRLAQTAIRLQAEGQLNLRPLISHVTPFAQAAEAFALLDRSPGEALQVVLDCRDAAGATPTA
jgi:2-desacetyl-2-hydroxyethyl bacteriochlorophyllide A dehydrogenase